MTAETINKKLLTLDEMMASLPKERQEKINERANEITLEYALSNLRKELNLSQKELAKAMGITQPSLSAMEKVNHDMKLVTLKKYIEGLGAEASLNVELPTGKQILIPL